MQNHNSSQLAQRISPDITSFTYNSLVAPGGGVDTQCSNASLFSTTISEIPQGLYEFQVGDNGEAKILCKICQYMSNKRSNFKRHFTNMHFVHEEEGTRQLECCGIRFSTKGEKFQHTKSVHKSGYKCKICTKVFDRPALLQRHLAKHTGKKPYKCSLCSYQTPNKANAKRHIEKKHSDIQEGSILFLTEDGEQIQMETVSRGFREQEQYSSSLPTTVVKSSADSSTSFGVFSSSALSSFISLTKSPTSTVTSSSFSPPTSILQLKAVPVDVFNRRRHISHSIDLILSTHAHNMCSLRAERKQERASTVAIPEDEAVASEHSSSSQQALNEREMAKHCTPNWSHISSPFPSCDYEALGPQPFFYPQSTCQISCATDTELVPRVMFRQCVHGCWHVDNHVTSDLSSFRDYGTAASFTTANFNHSPDSRSFSSVSQTENSSTTSVKSEDEDDDDDIIDVVGDDGEATTGLPLLSICEGLGNCSTVEKHVPMNGEEDGISCALGQPVESLSKSSSICSDDNSQHSHSPTSLNSALTNVNPEQYIPKKLRVCRAFLK